MSGLQSLIASINNRGYKINFLQKSGGWYATIYCTFKFRNEEKYFAQGSGETLELALLKCAEDLDKPTREYAAPIKRRAAPVLLNSNDLF